MHMKMMLLILFQHFGMLKRRVLFGDQIAHTHTVCEKKTNIQGSLCKEMQKKQQNLRKETI